MAKTRKTTQNKDKYSANTVTNSNNLASNSQTLSMGDTSTLNLDSLDSDTLRGLKGYGSAAKTPEFSHDHNLFVSFLAKLRHYLLVHNQIKHLHNKDISAEDNLSLYIAIANCLKGEALDLVQQQSFGNGILSYNKLCQKYLGNLEARKTKAMFDLLTLTQGQNESIYDLISRVDRIKHQLEEFGK